MKRRLYKFVTGKREDVWDALAEYGMFVAIAVIGFLVGLWIAR